MYNYFLCALYSVSALLGHVIHSQHLIMHDLNIWKMPFLAGARASSYDPHSVNWIVSSEFWNSEEVIKDTGTKRKTCKWSWWTEECRIAAKCANGNRSKHLPQWFFLCWFLALLFKPYLYLFHKPGLPGFFSIIQCATY